MKRYRLVLTKNSSRYYRLTQPYMLTLFDGCHMDSMAHTQHLSTEPANLIMEIFKGNKNLALLHLKSKYFWPCNLICGEYLKDNIELVVDLK